MKIQGDDIVFDSGRRVENACNCGILGLGPGADYINAGYDNGLCPIKEDEFDESPTFSQAEKAEICDYMIELWRKAKEISMK